MVWDWHAGYTFVRADGHSVLGSAPASGDPAIEIKLGNTACYRTRELTLPTAAALSPAQFATVHMQIDVDALFGGPNLIHRGSGYYLVVGGSAEAQKLATNFATAFRVDRVTNDPRP